MEVRREVCSLVHYYILVLIHLCRLELEVGPHRPHHVASARHRTLRAARRGRFRQCGSVSADPSVQFRQCASVRPGIHQAGPAQSCIADRWRALSHPPLPPSSAPILSHLRPPATRGRGLPARFKSLWETACF